MGNFSTLDYIVVIVYFAVIGGLGLWIARGKKSAASYFVANRSIPGWAVAFTLMATMISSGTMIGNPGTIYDKGMILLLGHLTLPIVLVFVALYIVPFYRNVVGMSAYEYINRRFGAGARVYSSLGFLADRVFDLGVTLITTAIPIHVMTGWDLITVVIFVGLFTMIYTMIGGVEAVVWTDVVQGFIIIGGMLLVLYKLLFAEGAGGPSTVIGTAWNAGRFDLGSFALTRESFLQGGTPSQWLIVFAMALNWGRRYVCDQHMVQRYLLARTDREAKFGAWWGAVSCVPIWVIFFFVGACLYGYYQLTGGAALATLENGTQVPVGQLGDGTSGPIRPDMIVPFFLTTVLPTGLIGLMLAAILAASMSSISADLNSVATVVTADYYVPMKPASTDAQRVIVGRIVVLVAGFFMTWAAFILIPQKGSAPIMERVVTIASILSGGSLGLFCLGFLTRRATIKGAHAGIAACLLLTGWGILTTGGDGRILDLGFNFTLHPIMIGILGHFLVFGVGYAASRLLGGHVPPDVNDLTFRRAR